MIGTFRNSVWGAVVGGVTVLAGGLAATAAGATEVKIFRAQSSVALAGGEFSGTSLDGEGRLRLAARFDRLAGIEEPFVFSVARRVVSGAGGSGESWVVGTGNEGKVLAIDAAGKVSELFRVEEPEVFALWVDPDGTVYAAGSPGGRVYRHAAGKTTMVFDSKERYVWALARSAKGELLVATGVEGRLFALDTKGNAPFTSRVAADTDATHLRSLLPLPDGRALIGTASDGRLLELSATGELRTLHDSALAEVVALAPVPSGGSASAASANERGLAYAAVLDSDAGFVEVAANAPAANPEAPPGEGAPKVEEAPRRSGTRSEILRLDRDGGVEALRSFNSDTVFALATHDGRLWIGSGLEGKLWSLRDDVLVLEKDFEERQLVGLVTGGRTLAAVATNGGALYRSTGALPESGTYTSEVLDAATASRFGALRWRGSSGAGKVSFSWRSGNAVVPDGTWTPWTPWAEGREFDLAALPTTRYVQWRVSLSAPGQAAETSQPIVSAIEIAYRARNLPPRVRRFLALEPGELLLPQGFAVGTQVFEPVHPTREGMFTGLGTPRAGEDPKLKSVWKRGMRTLRWEAEDANQDALRATLWARRESPSGPPGEWLEMVKDLADEFWSFDETALPDGVYRFKLAVTDEDANEPGDGVTVERLSEPVSIDGSAPRQRAAARRSNDAWLVEVEDGASPLRVAEWSADGGMWKPAIAVDGLVDGVRETLRVEAPTTARFVVLRVVDASWNVATFDLSESATR